MSERVRFRYVPIKRENRCLMLRRQFRALRRVQKLLLREGIISEGDGIIIDPQSRQKIIPY
jgi:hypothetical protein